jgi:beta-phosphoglucomutase-like phosphatase (HAD superfamily)
MDGTMIDSMPFHFRTWLETFQDLGVDLTMEQLKAANLGVISEVIRRLLGQDTTDEEVMRIATMKEERFKQAFRPHLNLLPGLADFLSRSKSLGIQMAIGTSAMYGNIDYIVDGLNLRGFFDAYAGDEDVQNGKPHPETFLVAAERLNTPAELCVVFEDSRAGLEAARRADMQVVYLATSDPKLEIEDWDHILICIQDYTTITPEEILELAKRGKP